MKNQKSFYLGLDIGTDSVGYATTDEKYNLLKFRGEPAWGVTIFDEASLQTERRSFRSARRRLDRRQQRVTLVQELFAPEIGKIDPRFYIRIKESNLYRTGENDAFTLFNDTGFTDKEYYEKYPTIHHLICDLMNDKTEHDVRLVYLACAWLVAHRGHFFQNIDVNNISKIRDFDEVYNEFSEYFQGFEGCSVPWSCEDIAGLGKILKKKQGVTKKYKELVDFLFAGKKPSKDCTEEFPFSADAIIKLLSGGTCKVKDLFCNEEYADAGSVSLGMDDDKLDEIKSFLGDDAELIDVLRRVFDWTLLNDVVGDFDSISQSKVDVYNTHEKDLAFLKKIIKKYANDKYNKVFRDNEKDNYVAYSAHSDNKEKVKKANKEDFSKFIIGIVKNITPESEDAIEFEDMFRRLELRTFLPKQKTTDNRVIPHQLYQYELNVILENAKEYLPFLNDTDDSGLSVSEKIKSVFLFRIPYFVGPLNSNSDYSWVVRKAGKIYPWNFEKMVDLDESENAFIKRMTNKCTYLPDQDVVAKDSLCYHKFAVLNEINNLKIGGERIGVELKQKIYNELFMFVKNVSRKKLIDFLISNGIIEKGQEETVSGIDVNINSNLSSQIAFRRLIIEGILSEIDVERIIERASYAEDKLRLSRWIEKEFPHVPEADRRYICGLKFKEFGRLSGKFLCEIEGTCKETGEVFTIIGALWNTQNNLMELLSERFTFIDIIRSYQDEYYSSKKMTVDARLDEMYVSNAVKRPIFRTLAIVDDVVKAFGIPKKIFVETTRGATEDQRNKRTKSRKDQILELYKTVDEDVRELKKQLEEMGDYANNKLQSDKLFLYYMQLGRCMYSGKPIDIEKLGSEDYCDIDHIYPQAFVKDDSLSNRVLCFSEINGEKSDKYPLSAEIRTKMYGFWKSLKDNDLISEEKFKRLTRATVFTDDEKYGFINRQLVETSQSVKAVATLLKEKYPETEIVYCKAKLVSEFRQEFNLFKSRKFNDLHHAVDAYLNIVTGNVYSMKFTKNWFDVNSRYSLKTKTLFTNSVDCNGVTVWDGKQMLETVRKTAVKNTAHFTVYSYQKHRGQNGGFFDQNPLSKSDDLFPLKKGLDPKKYGGYNGLTTTCFVLVRYTKGKKKDIMLFPVDLINQREFFLSEENAIKYITKTIGNEKIHNFDLPLGMRKIKVNTVFSLDGFRVCLVSGSLKDGRCGFKPIVQFNLNSEFNNYFKRLERFIEKININPSYVYDEEYDYVSKSRNTEIYRIYINKLENSIYKKRPKSEELCENLKKYQSNFEKLDIFNQCKQLLMIHMAFGRSSNPIDLSLIGGVKTGCKARENLNISNWKKKYSDVRIIDSSASGLWEKKSVNLLDLL